MAAVKMPLSMELHQITFALFFFLQFKHSCCSKIQSPDLWLPFLHCFSTVLNMGGFCWWCPGDEGNEKTNQTHTHSQLCYFCAIPVEIPGGCVRIVCAQPTSIHLRKIHQRMTCKASGLLQRSFLDQHKLPLPRIQEQKKGSIKHCSCMPFSFTFLALASFHVVVCFPTTRFQKHISPNIWKTFTCSAHQSRNQRKLDCLCTPAGPCLWITSALI